MMSEPRGHSEGLSPAEMHVWRDFLRAHDYLIRMLDADLRADQEMTISEFDVLIQLSMADGQRMRMRDLAHATLFSPSGLTRLCERLERGGLVSREGSAGDLRGTDAVLTDRGRERVRRAMPVHARSIKKRFACRFSAAELAQFGVALERICKQQPSADPG
jgi:DNA-binding MarR family transcriptional regulator